MSKIELISPEGDIRDLLLGTTPAAVPAVPGTIYRITGNGSGNAPRIVRDGNDLIVQGLSNDVELTVTDFYLACRGDNDCSVVLDNFDGLNNEVITPQTQPLAALSSGRFVIFSSENVTPASPDAETGSGIGWGSILGAGGGVLLLAGLAGGSSPSPDAVSSSPAPAPTPAPAPSPSPSPNPEPTPAPPPAPEAPTVTVSSNGTIEPTIQDIGYTFVFSESVVGFSADDILISGGTVVSFSGSGASYSAVIAPNSNEQGSLTVNVPANSATTVNGVGNLAGNAAPVLFDRLSPDLNITDNESAVASGPVIFTFTFTEPVIGFNIDSIDIESSGDDPVVGNLAAINSNAYQLTITPPDDQTGVLRVSVDPNEVTDQAGNGNLGSTQIQPFAALDFSSSSIQLSTSLLPLNHDAPPI